MNFNIDDPSKILEKTASELVKPVYQDAVQPLAKEIGRGLGTIGETTYQRRHHAA